MGISCALMDTYIKPLWSDLVSRQKNKTTLFALSSFWYILCTLKSHYIIISFFVFETNILLILFFFQVLKFLRVGKNVPRKYTELPTRIRRNWGSCVSVSSAIIKSFTKSSVSIF